jgi:hypothetical protein
MAHFRTSRSWNDPAEGLADQSPGRLGDDSYQLRRLERPVRIGHSAFESSQPSQPPRSRPGNVLHCANRRHFRGLAAKSLVSGGQFWESRTEGRKSRGKSLLDEFSISKFRNGTVQRPVAFLQRRFPSQGGQPRFASICAGGRDSGPSQHHKLVGKRMAGPFHCRSLRCPHSRNATYGLFTLGRWLLL